MWKLHAIWFHAEVGNQFHAPAGSTSVKEHVHAMTLAMVGKVKKKVFVSIPSSIPNCIGL
jgi:hypothetical protein